MHAVPTLFRNGFPPLAFIFSLCLLVPSFTFTAEILPEAKTMLSQELAAQRRLGSEVLMTGALPYRWDVDSFYRARNHDLAWIKHGHPVKGAWELLGIIRNSDQEGLEPNDYPITTLETMLHKGFREYFWSLPLDPKVAAHLDLLLTGTYMTIAHHLLFGRIQPTTPEEGWHVSTEPILLPKYLEAALGGAGKIGQSLKDLTPREPEYGKLKYWLGRYRELELDGGWPQVPAGLAFEIGSQGPHITALCLRLLSEGYFTSSSCQDIFTAELEKSLARFQASHGLKVDSTLGIETLAQLNVPLSKRIAQIKSNLDCWRWLPQDLGERHIQINIADYRLKAFEQDRKAFSMKVVVGRKSDSTPVFSDRAIAVCLNPAWNVPASIAKEEFLPELKKNPNYLAEHDMELLADWTHEETLLKPDSIDWNQVSADNFKFRIRQKFGASSALGQVKIVLTNPFNIYLHDTPSKQAFAKDKRALSHGCVRVEEPLKLAAWLLGTNSDWSEAHLKSEIAKGDPKTISLPNAGIPIHILYRTAFVDVEGGLQFRPDIYGWDKRFASGMVAQTANR